MTASTLIFAGKVNTTPVLHCFLEALVGKGINCSNLTEIRLNVLPTWGQLAAAFENNATIIQQAFPELSENFDKSEKFEPSLFYSWLVVLSEHFEKNLDPNYRQALEDLVLLAALKENTPIEMFHSDAPITVDDLAELLRYFNDGHNMVSVETAWSSYKISCWSKTELQFIQDYQGGIHRKVTSQKLLNQTEDQYFVATLNNMRPSTINQETATVPQELELRSYMKRAGFSIIPVQTEPETYSWYYADSATDSLTQSPAFPSKEIALEEIEKCIVYAVTNTLPVSAVEWEQSSEIKKNLLVLEVY